MNQYSEVDYTRRLLSMSISPYASTKKCVWCAWSYLEDQAPCGDKLTFRKRQTYLQSATYNRYESSRKALSQFSESCLQLCSADVIFLDDMALQAHSCRRKTQVSNCAKLRLNPQRYTKLYGS